MSDEVQADENQFKHKRSPQLPKMLVNQIKLEYLEGKGSIRELAEKYGVSDKALAMHCVRGKWRVESAKVVEKVVETVEKRENSRLDLLRSHEDRMRKRMEKRLVSVDRSLEQVGDLVEPQELRAIVSTEATIDQVIRRSLGADDKVPVNNTINIDVTGILDKIRASQKPGMVLDVEAVRSELKDVKLIEG